MQPHVAVLVQVHGAPAMRPLALHQQVRPVLNGGGVTKPAQGSPNMLLPLGVAGVVDLHAVGVANDHVALDVLHGLLGSATTSLAKVVGKVHLAYPQHLAVVSNPPAAGL